MSNFNFPSNSNVSSIKQLSIAAGCIGVIASLVSGFVVSQFNTHSIPSNAATPNSNSLDVIVGQVTNGSNVELSVCLKTDATNTNLHITDASSTFQFNPANLTPSSTIMATGNFGGNGVSSASYAPLKWNSVIGTNDRWSMDITYTDGTGTQLTTTPSLVGQVQFAGSGAITSFNQEFFSVETTTGPMNANVINYSGLCTNYPMLTTTSSSVISSSSNAAAVSQIGTPIPTVSSPLTGTTGSQLGTIMLAGNTYPNGTIATFTPAGSLTFVTGTIQGGNFVPNANQPLPASATLGANVGVLRVSGNPTGVNVPTNFAAPAATASNSGGTITITNNQNTTSTISSVSSTVAVAATPAVNANTPKTNTVNSGVIQINTPKPTANVIYDNSTIRSGGMDITATVIITSVILLLIANAYNSQNKFYFLQNLQNKITTKN